MPRIRSQPVVSAFEHRPPRPAGKLAVSPFCLLPALALLLAAWGPAPVGAQEAAASPSLAAFEALHAEVLEAVAEGSLPPDAGTAAEELHFGLRKELIRSDAEIEILKLEVTRFTGEQQEKALDALLLAVAARERLLCEGTRKLEGLAGTPAAAAPAASAPADSSAAAESVPEDEKGKGKRKKRKLDITFEPEDPTKDPHGGK